MAVLKNFLKILSQLRYKYNIHWLWGLVTYIIMNYINLWVSCNRRIFFSKAEKAMKNQNIWWFLYRIERYPSFPFFENPWSFHYETIWRRVGCSFLFSILIEILSFPDKKVTMWCQEFLLGKFHQILSSYKPGLSETNLAATPSVLRLKHGNWKK